jgi:peptidoglycan/LPS O-acetylase OafA/YrhL
MIVTTKKDLPLEVLRGLAAISVLLSHLIEGFFPQWSGDFPDKWPIQMAIIGHIWYGAFNGSAAVTLFFVLSAFVLTRHFLTTGNQQIILRGAVKRWPRLAGPVLVTVLVSWLLFKFDAYRFTEGGAATGSPWLSKFANAFQAFVEPFQPRFWDAVRQGAFLTFVRGDSYYDTSLWTMRYEFAGSFIAFGLALLTALIPHRVYYVRIWLIGMVLLLCHFASPQYAAFPAGVALAAFLPVRSASLPGVAVAMLILLAFYLFGFTGVETGAFVLVARIFGSLPTSYTYAHIVGSVLVITAIELAPDTFRRRLSSRFAYFIGALSFPLYLVHVLVLCSLGCATLIWADTWLDGHYPGIIAGVATILGSVLAAIPLMLFNEQWVRLVNKAINLMLAPDLAAPSLATTGAGAERVPSRQNIR